VRATKLNGWQRLWVVLSVLSLLIAITFSWDLRPTREEIYQQWASEQWDVIERDHPRVSEKSYWQFRQALKESSDSGLVARLNRNAVKSRIDSLKSVPALDSFLIRSLEHVSTIQPKYEQRLARFSQAYVLFWTKVVGWWMGFMALLYLAGWSVGWIVRGFRGTRLA